MLFLKEDFVIKMFVYFCKGDVTVCISIRLMSSLK